MGTTRERFIAKDIIFSNHEMIEWGTHKGTMWVLEVEEDDCDNICWIKCRFQDDYFNDTSYEKEFNSLQELNQYVKGVEF